MTLDDLVRSAWSTGKAINLDGIGYGRIHWGNRQDVKDEPSAYYYFLAGLVQEIGATNIVELGTHWGGATRAMWTAVQDKESSKVVTIDISTESDARLGEFPEIIKIVGDGNGEAVLREVSDAYSDEVVDLVYIDAAHTCIDTFISYSLYSKLLRPKYIVLDDITLTNEMSRAWDLIKRTVPEADAIDAAKVESEIRPGPGFGIVRLR